VTRRHVYLLLLTKIENFPFKFTSTPFQIFDQNSPMSAELHVRVVEAVDIPRMDLNATDAYLIMRVNGAAEKRTRVIQNCMQPRWNEEFHWTLLSPATSRLSILMRDEDVMIDDDISRLEILLSSFPIGKVVDQWFEMVPARHVRKGGRLHLVVHIGRVGEAPFVFSASQPGGYGQQARYPPLGSA
jgi:hypothetical protein